MNATGVLPFDQFFGRRQQKIRVAKSFHNEKRLCDTALTFLFPTPGALARVDLDGLGISRLNVARLKEIVRAVIQGELDFAASSDCVRSILSKLGVEPTTIENIALRALGEPDAFPATDFLLRHITANSIRPLSALELEERAEAWRPWRGYAAVPSLECNGRFLLRTRYQRADTFRKNGSQWKLIASHLSVARSDPPAQEVSKESWGGLVGV